MSFWYDWTSISDIYGMICITLCVKEIRVLMFFWFMYLLLWSIIGGGFLQFYEFYFLSTWWVHVDGAWGIPCHVWEQKNKALLVHSYIHRGALWYIEDYRKFRQWCAWVHQPSDLVILHVISRFGSALLQWEV